MIADRVAIFEDLQQNETLGQELVEILRGYEPLEVASWELEFSTHQQDGQAALTFTMRRGSARISSTDLISPGAFSVEAVKSSLIKTLEKWKFFCSESGRK